MFKFLSILRDKILSFSVFLKLTRYFSNLADFFIFTVNAIYSVYNYFRMAFTSSRFFAIYRDLREFFLNKIAYAWLLITKHRLFYIIRLLFIVFLLYKPVLIDLDSIYWLGSTVFYFFSNTFFFFLSAAIPGSVGFTSSWLYKTLLTLSFFPAFFVARRLKKRLRDGWTKRAKILTKLKKRRKILIADNEVLFIFKWVQQFFVHTFYYVVLFVIFIFSSYLIPVVYIYLTEFDFIFVTKLVFSFYLSSYTFLFLPFFYLMSLTSFFIFYFFYQFIFLVAYFLFNYFVMIFFSFFKFFLLLLPSLLAPIFYFLLSLFHLYFSSTYQILIASLSFLVIFVNDININFFTFKNLDMVIDVYKNFLFSDNYLSFIISILAHIFKTVILILSNFFVLFLSYISSFALLILGDSNFNLIATHLSIAWSYIAIFFYDKLILILEWSASFYNLYFSKVSPFGLFSTWYEYLNHNVQKGDSKNSLINWLLIHIYLSIIVFWFLDFDFRVSVKSPPKTPYTLLEEAKKTYDWVPADMDFGSMQTDHTAVYFALLDISFEHVESLNFIYGDFEYIDEEYDHEDDTPDEDEFFNDVEETTTVREIIDTDLHAGRKAYPSSAQFNPLNSKTSYERHYLTEIVGEPELTYIEKELKWMYESIYTPSFEELHFKDSLFSEWVFDPDEDLTLFEVLIFFPIFFYFIFVWFYHRRPKKHYKIWLRYMIPTRRTAYSGSYVEDLFGISLGDYGKYLFDKMRKYKSPEVRVKNFYRLKLQRNNQRLKLLQVESFFFEKLRHKAYRKALKEWEKGLNIGVEFLVPRKRLPQFYTGIKNLKVEMKTWAKLGDWIKFDRFSGEHKYKGGFHRYEHYQYDLPALLDMYMMKVARIRKRKRFLWRTINKLPGHNLMALRAKFWHSRFGNTELFFPTHKMKYSYNYYNYIGWRENRTQWRRYAFTPGNVANRIWDLNRGTPEGSYRSFRGYQRKRRLMKSFQF